MSSSSSVITSSVSVIEKKDIADRHFRWDSIQKFIFLANAYSNHAFNFDLFSKAAKFQVLIVDSIVWQILIGMPHLFMDGFIKQYTRRIDGFKFLNPLLKGITFGLCLQTACMTLVQSEYLADSLRFFIMAFKADVPWTHCYAESKNSSCVSLFEIITKYRNNKITEMNTTAAHYHYIKQYIAPDKSVTTTRCFAVAIVWMINFFICTVSDETLVKIYYFLFVFRSVSTIVVGFILILSVESEPSIALKVVMSLKAKADLPQSFTQIAFAYGVGFLGFYDFGTMSPYTMIDTAVVIYFVLFTVFSVIRSWFVKILILRLKKFVKVPYSHPHYLLFAVLPLSTEFVRAHRMYAFYLYMNFVITLTGYLTMQTLTMARLFHTEFRSLKTMYIVGVICCLGFVLSLPFTLASFSNNERIMIGTGFHLCAFLQNVPCGDVGDVTELAGLGYTLEIHFIKLPPLNLSPLSFKARAVISGLTIALLYLGAFKVITIMWVYGIEKFSTDIQFWLGFKPTKYWRLCWAVMPIFLMIMLIYRIWRLYVQSPPVVRVGASIWVGATVLLVAIFNIKTLSKLLVRSNLASIFTATFRYGPPDPTDRLRRRVYSETIQLRYCKHNCLVIDELIDCNHKPLISSPTGSKASKESLTKDIYKAEGTGLGHMSIRHPSMYNLEHHHF